MYQVKGDFLQNIKADEKIRFIVKVEVLTPLKPFKGKTVWGCGSPGWAQLQPQASVGLEKASYLKEAHWSNHMLPTPQCGAALCSPSAPPLWTRARSTAPFTPSYGVLLRCITSILLTSWLWLSWRIWATMLIHFYGHYFYSRAYEVDSFT